MCFAGWRSPSKKGSTLEGKNLLQEEQILSFKSWPSFRREVNENKGVASPESLPIHRNKNSHKILSLDSVSKVV